MSWGKLKSHLASTVGRKQDEETVEEFCKQSTELKKNKKYRLVRRQAKQREDLRVTREGITYEAGGFDETQLCKVGKKRRTKEPKHTFK